MCIQNTRRAAAKAKATTRLSSKPERKLRTRRRKPKFLSLKLQLSSSSISSSFSTSQKDKPATMPHQQQQLINLFPLHPEKLVQDREIDHVAFLFADDDSTTLHGLFDTTTTTATTTAGTTTTSSDQDQDQLSPPSLMTNEEERNRGSKSNWLVRRAMRCKEREPSDQERWVSYCELVEKKEQEEVSSNCYGDADSSPRMMQGHGDRHDSGKGLVGLKLDYQEVLNAWSNKGSLYIEGECPQTVPDLHDCSDGIIEGLGNTWRVPEMKVKEKLGNREASVLRYKEKRRSRLFSKKIRYEVRKLNAEKRPRLKGRFVKASGED